MIMRIEENVSQKELEVLIKCAQKNHKVERLLELIRSVDKTVTCRTETSMCWMSASDIYYIESVDKKTFIYGEKLVYCTDLRLYQLIEELSDAGFVQVSKSCMINLQMLDSIRPLFNSRMEATLTNGERLTVTRKFIPSIKNKLLERR